MENNNLLSKKVANTCDCIITNARRDGNTTRNIDKGIELLFKGNIVVIQDHFNSGNDRKSNLSLLNKIQNRLHNESNLTFLIDSKSIFIDRKIPAMVLTTSVENDELLKNGFPIDILRKINSYFNKNS